MIPYGDSSHQKQWANYLLRTPM